MTMQTKMVTMLWMAIELVRVERDFKVENRRPRAMDDIYCHKPCFTFK
jgi:hypothetical protein